MSEIEKSFKKFTKSWDLSDYQVLGDEGWVDCFQLHQTEPYQIHHIVTKSGKFLQCADDHLVFRADDSLAFVKDLLVGDLIQTIDGNDEIVSYQILPEFVEMYDIELVIDSNKRYYTNGILSHNTTTYCIFVVWYICFNEDKHILILANKLATAMEIMSRICIAFELLPKWIKPRVKEWNKGRIKLSNGCIVEGCATASDAARGKSANCIAGDSLITIKRANVIHMLSVNLLLDQYQATDCHQISSTEKWFLYDDITVMTSSGFQPFRGIREINESSIGIRLRLEEGYDINCTLDHKLFNEKNTLIEASKYRVGDYLATDRGPRKIIGIEGAILDKKYDLLNVENGNRFFANGIDISNCLIIDECAFVPNNIMDKLWGAVYPIISSSKTSKCILVSTPNGTGNLYYDIYQRALSNKVDSEDQQWVPFRFDWFEVPGRDEEWKRQQLESFNGDEVRFAQEFGNEFLGSSYTLIEPSFIIAQRSRQSTEPKPKTITFNDFEIKIYVEPQPNHAYAIGVDVADGSGQDSTVITVFDITNPVREIEEVAFFAGNTYGPTEAAYVACKLGMMYNNAPLMIERNNMGNSTVDFASQIYEYENIASIGSRKLGILSNNQLKVDACLMFKNYCSKVDIIFHSTEIINEMEYFAKRGDGNNFTYSATQKKKDDHIMSSIWAIYLLKSEHLEMFFDVTYSKIGIEEYPDTVTNMSFTIEDKRNIDEMFKTINSNNQKYRNISVAEQIANLEEDDEDEDVELGFFDM